MLDTPTATPDFEGGLDMNTTVLHRRIGRQSLSARAWALISAFLTEIAELDIRQGKSEPFGL